MSNLKSDVEINKIVDKMNNDDRKMEQRGRKKQKRNKHRTRRDYSNDRIYLKKNYNKPFKKLVECVYPWVSRQKYVLRVGNQVDIKGEMKIQYDEYKLNN